MFILFYLDNYDFQFGWFYVDDSWKKILKIRHLNYKITSWDGPGRVICVILNNGVCLILGLYQKYKLYQY